MGKYLKLFFTFILTSLISSSALAQEKGPFYAGFDLGLGTFDNGCTFPSYVVVLDCEENTFSITGKIGYQLIDNLAVEAFYGTINPIEANFRIPTLSNLTYDAEADYSSLGINALIKYEASNDLFLTGRIGFHQWDSEATSSVARVTTSSDGTDLVLGVGGQYGFQSNLSIGGGYDIYFGDGSDFKVFNFGLTYNF